MKVMIQLLMQKSEFIFNYLVSDNYCYTIKNFNKVAPNWFKGLCQQLASLFTLGQSNQYWSRGMIDIWEDNGKLGNEGKYYDSFEPGSIKIDTDKKTMEIKRGWFNNSMTYNLDGWTGRYGMPIDFLLSIHLATMMPDLAYDMAVGFETQIKLLLHPVGGGEKDENTAIGYYDSGDGNKKSYDDFYEAAKSGWTGALNAWRISKKEAMNIMKEFGIPSPDNCIGTADVGEDELENKDSSVNMTYSEHWYSATKRVNDDDYDSNEAGPAKKQEVVDAYNAMIQKFKEYGASDDNITSANLKSSISSFSDFLDMQQEGKKEENIQNLITYKYYEDPRSLSTTVSWMAPSGTADYALYTAEVTLSYSNYDSTTVNYGAPPTISTTNRASITYKIYGEWSDSKLQAWLDENEISTPDEAKCHNLDNEECCSVCRKYIQSIYDKLKDVDVSDLDIYEPYISKVIDHWYRDVYFVAGSNMAFVDNDYDYEALMKERWTLYETYPLDDPERAGEFKLYEINDDGSYKKNGDELVLYDGTQEEAEKSGIKVAKRASMVKIDDVAEDLNWNEIDNKYSAYQIKSSSNTSYEPAYPDVTPDDKEYNIKKNIYVKLITTGNVVQTGEGLRTETNSKIKKMFLNNKYFRYDGSVETAEAITELRNTYSIPYGPVQGINVEGKEVDYTDKELAKKEGETGDPKTVADFSGEVSLNQDSLNAFSMLENEHTLDADYIYRDFKELIVELGYFGKEELTDETPRLLEFPVPEIGSAGFPYRMIDKKENENGTMIHSKGDIDAAKKQSIEELLKKADEEGEPGNPPEAPNNNSQFDVPDDDVPQQPISKLTKDSSLNIIGKVASIESTPVTDLRAVGSIVEVTPANYTYTPTGESGQTKKIADLDFNGVNYECWFQSQVTCTLYSFSFVASAYTDTSFEEYKKEQPPYWTSGLAWSCWKTAGVEGVFYGAGDAAIPPTVEEQGSLISEALEEGKPVYFYSGFGSSAGCHAIVLLGADDDGKILYYNPWGGVVTTYGSSSKFSENLKDLLTTGAAQKGGHLYSFFIPDEPPKGVRRDNEKQYEGYLGNEAVVSPVTGILLEYDTYDGEEYDTVSGEKYRTNIDLKYETKGLFANDTEDPQAEPQPEPQLDKEIEPEKVGYAKILVLDDENYKKLETDLKGSTMWSNDSVVPEIDDLNDDKIEDWTDVDKTLYGYKEFVENYKETGLSGYIIYMEGFKCELPDEEFDNTSKDDLENKIPDGEDLSVDSFKTITKGSFDSDGKISSSVEVPQSKYLRDEDYKLASKKATEKLNTENKVKEEALPSISVNDNLTIIKEGTVIGRTLTDKELLESPEYRGGRNGTYESIRKGDDVTPQVIGNYIRVIMSDEEKTVVENVEDYMKLDTGNARQKCEFEQLAYFLGCLEEGFNEDMDLGSSYGVTVLKDGAGNTTAFGLTKAVAGLDSVKSAYPNFGVDLANGNVPKQEAQDVFILTMESAKEAIQERLNTPFEEDDSNLFALIDLHHAGPALCYDVIDVYNAKNNNLTKDELIDLYSEHWGSNTNYETLLKRRGRNRGFLAAEGRFLLYQEGSAGDEVIFDSETPWTEFCEGGGSRDMITQDCGLYHIEKGADPG